MATGVFTYARKVKLIIAAIQKHITTLGQRKVPNFAFTRCNRSSKI